MAVLDPRDRFHDLRIIVADDDLLLQLDLSGILEEEGYQVVARVSDGRELVEEARKLAPDLIITDVRMPRKSGVDAVKQIYDEQRVPVIFISAYPCGDVLREFPGAACLAKPFDDRTLKRTIETVLRTRAEFYH